ncbi:hypothetical protein [Kordia jejudonensis]|uniref:hypothetical protein n=1 Tax=Kordia jejudonensis TaxID=1348245 RepID=UPI0006293C2A|nr:hypothetical protein [Kordia jejudonensis]
MSNTDIKSVIIEKIQNISGQFSEEELATVEEIEIKKIGLDSMVLIGFLLELEEEGYIDISEIEYEEAPETIGDIISIISKQDKAY